MGKVRLGLIWFAIVLGILMGWMVIPGAIWKYLFFLRLPILIGLFLVMLPLFANRFLPALLKNLFVLRTWWQLAAVIVSAFTAGMVTVLVGCVILNNAPARFGVPATEIVLSEYWQYLLAIALSAYICVVAFSRSQEKLNIQERLAGAIVGNGLGIALLYTVYVVRDWFESNTAIITFFADLITFLARHDTSGYIEPTTHKLISDHLTTTALLICLGAIYLIIGIRFKPKPQTERIEVPALMYLLLIVAMVTLFYGGATFYFDYFRVPVLILLLLFSAFKYAFFGVDHFFDLFALKESSDKQGMRDSVTFKQVLEKRLQGQTGKRTLVIVCASGGGIQASGWTVQVLTGLQTILGTSFTQAIGLISAVSGGSVGTMYYLDHFTSRGYPELEYVNNQGKREKDDTSEGTFTTIFRSATKDSLDAVSWGLAYPDMWRFIGFPFLVSPDCDRGAAIEKDWQGEMRNPQKRTTLATWRKQMVEGEIPIPIFNSILVETGERFLITPMTFDNPPERKCNDFNRFYGKDLDMNVVTAARLSATFPYVSPICCSNKGIPKGKNYHFADGGYFDNSGFVTASEWLDTWLAPEKALGIERVLVLQINPFPESVPTPPGSGGWFMAVVGPLLALFKVRDPVLTSRSAMEADLLIKKWKNKQVEIEYVPIFFPSAKDVAEDSAVSKLYRNQQYRPPLSWRLTDQEKQAIKDGWDAIKDRKTVNYLKKIWHDRWNMPKYWS